MTSPAMAEMMFGLAGAVRLARFDVSGLAFFVASGRGAIRSFRALALVIPAYVALVLVRGDLPADTPGGWLMVVEAIRFVINATAFPVVMSYIAPLIGREARFPLFICAYNWSVPVQMAVILPAEVVTTYVPMPDGIASGLLLGVTLAMTVYQVFINRVTLLLSWRGAVLMAMLDLVTSIMVSQLALALER